MSPFKRNFRNAKRTPSSAATFFIVLPRKRHGVFKRAARGAHLDHDFLVELVQLRAMWFVLLEGRAVISTTKRSVADEVAVNDLVPLADDEEPNRVHVPVAFFGR